MSKIRAAHYSNVYPFKMVFNPTQCTDPEFIEFDDRPAICHEDLEAAEKINLVPIFGRDRTYSEVKKTKCDRAEPNAKRGGQFLRRKKGCLSIINVPTAMPYETKPEPKHKYPEKIKSLGDASYHLPTVKSVRKNPRRHELQKFDRAA